MHEPTGDLTIINSINQIHSAYDVSTRKYMSLAVVLHCMAIDVDFALGIEDKLSYCWLVVLGAKSTDDVISFNVDLFFCEAVLLPIKEILLELHGSRDSILLDHFRRT